MYTVTFWCLNKIWKKFSLIIFPFRTSIVDINVVVYLELRISSQIFTKCEMALIGFSARKKTIHRKTWSWKSRDTFPLSSRGLTVLIFVIRLRRSFKIIKNPMLDPGPVLASSLDSDPEKWNRIRSSEPSNYCTVLFLVADLNIYLL